MRKVVWTLGLGDLADSAYVLILMSISRLIYDTHQLDQLNTMQFGLFVANKELI